MVETIMKDEKVQKILEMLGEGNTREGVADYYKQGWKAVDMYMRRKGFVWGKEEQTYIMKVEESEPSEAIQEAILQNTKAAQIVRMLNVKHPNVRQTSSKQGFETIDDMGAYMKGEGYVWDNELNNYRYDETVTTVVTPTIETTSALPAGTMDKDTLLNYLLGHQHELINLLQAPDAGKLTTYTFKGAKVNKTLGLASTVEVLLSDYSKEFNITQRAIIETALAEFFKKYGYKEQLQQAIS